MTATPAPQEGLLPDLALHMCYLVVGVHRVTMALLSRVKAAKPAPQALLRMDLAVIHPHASFAHRDTMVPPPLTATNVPLVPLPINQEQLRLLASCAHRDTMDQVQMTATPAQKAPLLSEPVHIVTCACRDTMALLPTTATPAPQGLLQMDLVQMFPLAIALPAFTALVQVAATPAPQTPHRVVMA